MPQQEAPSFGTVEDLGRFAKTKFPKYESVPDAELGRFMKKKYPKVYDAVKDAADLPPTPVGAEKPSAASRLLSNAWEATGVPQIPEMVGTAKDIVAGSSEERLGAMKRIKQGFIDPQLEMFNKSGDSFSKGDYIDWVGYSLAGALPGAGPQIMHGYEQVKSGDVAGGAGTWMGTIAPYAITEGLSGLAGKTRNLAPKVYEGAVKFPEGLSLEERARTSERGIGRNEPAGAPPDSAVKATQQGMREIEQRIGKDHAEVLRRISKVTANGVDIDRDYILHPIQDLADKIKNSGDSTAAKPLYDLIDKFKKDNPGQYVNPNRVQELKENTDLLLKDTNFAESAKLTGKTAGLMALRDGMRQMLEQVADIQQLNWANHEDFQLKDAINRAIKTKPNVVYRSLPYIFTAGGIGLGIFGQTHYAEAALAAAAARAAMNSPHAMTQLAIMLDRAGVAVPKGIRIAGATIPGSQAFRNAEQRKDMNLKVDRVMEELLGVPSAEK